MKIAVVDDEQKWLSLALDVVRNYTDERDEIDVYDSGVEFLSKKIMYDVVFVDIEMPEKDGFDTSMEYKAEYPGSVIIILTTHLELSRRGYIVDAFRYIDKTAMNEEIAEAFDKIKQLRKRNEYYIVGRDKEVTKNISINEILYIETKSKGVMIHTENEVYLSDEKINNLEGRLEEYDFFRSHKSYLINLNAIEKMDKQFVYFNNGKKAYISVRKYVETKRHYIFAKKKYASM